MDKNEFDNLTPQQQHDYKYYGDPNYSVKENAKLNRQQQQAIHDAEQSEPSEQDLVQDGFSNNPQYGESLKQNPNSNYQANNFQQQSQPQPQSNQSYAQNSQKPMEQIHWKRWILGGIVGLFLLLGVGIYHEVSELGNTQRTQDTMLDNMIKQQGEQIAKDKAPAQVKPQIIKIIQKTPLSELQQAADSQAMLDRLALNNGISQADVQKANQAWFTPSTTQARQDIANGNVMGIPSALNQIKNAQVKDNLK